MAERTTVKTFVSDPTLETPPRHLRLYGVEVVVRDPDRSLDFYVNLLGFRLFHVPDARDVRDGGVGR